MRAVADHLARGADGASLFAGGAPAREPFVFFDLETTGLNGGAGTHVFLVGCASFDDGDWVTRQFVMTRFADERRLLQTVSAVLAGAGALVSFNGKSFDAPLLETRYLFHRMEWIGSRIPHLDVLHAARRFWGAGLARSEAGCSLVALERAVLGRTRAGDLDGFEIPRRYFQFVRTGDPRPLVPVLEHNRLDLLSLAALTARLLHLARVGPEATKHAREALALGHVYARAGFDARARDAFLRAIAMRRVPAGIFDATVVESLRALALAWRRARRWDEAARCWQQLADIRGCPPHLAQEATEALAIHHEHRARDLAAARTFALRGLEHAERERRPAWREAVEHRLARLDRKLVRATATPSPTLSLPLQPSCAAPTSALRTSS